MKTRKFGHLENCENFSILGDSDYFNDFMECGEHSTEMGNNLFLG